MRVVALAGGIGAGKFLRGLVRAVPAEDVTVIGNTGDDLELHGLSICPDLDSLTYWLAGLSDRERGWGRHGESFRVLEELRLLGGEAWFSLGDLDLATHLARTHWLREGVPLSEVTDRLRRVRGVEARILPMSDDPVRTWISAVGPDGDAHVEPFQEYWVVHRARCEVQDVEFRGASEAAPAPGVLDAISTADRVVICPSNPVVSIRPVLSVPGVAEAVRARRDDAVAVSPIVGGAPVLGMADRLMPGVGLEVSAAGVAAAYRDLAGALVIDERDAELAPRIREETGLRVEVTDTIMTGDEAAERLARVALEASG